MTPLFATVGTWPSDQPTRDEIRHTATEVFGRAEFQQHKSLLQRFVEWLQHLFPSTGGGGGSFAAAGGLFFYLALFALLVLLVFLIVMVVRSVRGRTRRQKIDDVETIVDPEVARTVGEWRSEAERAEADERWKDAMLCRYRELVGELVERGAVRAIPGLTTGELRVEVARSVPGELDAFSEATTLFELPWYARASTGPDENRRFRDLAGGLLDRVPAQVTAVAPS
jgi:Domain of unknown function (DUF4129)